MPSLGNFTASVDLDFRKAQAQAKRFQSTLSKGFQKNGLGKAAGDARDFERTLGQATNRVVAFGAAAVVFNTLSKSVSNFAESIIEVDKALTEINVNLGQSADGLKVFGSNLFNAARQTGASFETAAKAAVELARQGLTAEETIKRLNDGLILTRISGLSAEDSISALTAAINTFNKEALTSADVVAKFAAVDTQFAVSSKDLAEAVSRVGSAAQGAGVGIDQLIGLVTSLQQTTQLGGSNIANALKTIFTRVTANPETISALQSVGVSIKDTNGNLRDGISILQDYARARDNLGEVEKQSLDRTVGSTFQINKLKAALADVAKVNGIYAQATKTSANATDEAIRKNAQLNQTLSSLINQTELSVKQLVASIGNIDFAPILKNLLGFVETARKYLSGESGDSLGTSLGQGLLHGLSNVLSGPVLAGIAVVLFSAFKKIFSTIAAEAQTLFKINTEAATRAKIQERINILIQNANAFEIAQYNAAKNTTQQKEILIGVQQRLNRELLIGTELQNALLVEGGIAGSVNPGIRPGKRPIFANPLASAIAKESQVSGLPTSQVYVDRDPRVASASNPGGLMVANTRDEPLGGYQGVQRVIASGGNPKSGSVPGFALSGRDLPFVPKKALADINKILDLAQEQTTKSGFFSEISKATDISLSGSLSKGNTKTLDKEIDRIITDRLKLEKQIEIGRFKGAKRAKDFAEQNARLTDLQERLKENAAKVESTRLIRASGRNQFGSPIGPRPEDPGFLIRPALPPRPGYNVNSIQYQSPIGPKPQLSIAEALAAGRASKVRDYTLESDPFDRVSSGARASDFPDTPEQAARRQQVNQMFTSGGDKRSNKSRNRGESKATRLARLQDEAEARETQRNRAFGLAFLAPFAGGFIPDAPGGTAGGIVSGGLKGAAEGASAGVFGPQAAVIGVAVGALVGALGKLTQSTEEFNEVIDKGVAVQQASVDAIGKVISINGSLKEHGLSNEATGRFGRQRAEALQGVDPEFRAQLSQANLTEDQQAEIIGKAVEKARQASLTGDVQKGGRDLNQKTYLERIDSSLGNSDIIKTLFKNPSGLSSLKSLFENPFDNINKARGVGSSLSGKLTDQNVGSVDQSLLNRIIGGKSQAGDTDKLSATFEALGVKVEVTADRQVEFAEALKTATARFTEVNKLIAQFKANAQPIGLRPGAFNNAAESQPIQNAAFAGRNPFLFSQTQKGRSQYGFYQSLIGAGALDQDRLEKGADNSPFKRAEAANRSDYALKAGLDYVRGSRLGGGQYTDFRGEPIAKALETALRSLSKDKGQNGEQAGVLLDLVQQAQETRANAGLKTPPVSSGYNLPRGVTYSTYAPDRGDDAYRMGNGLQGTAPEGRTIRSGFNVVRTPDSEAPNHTGQPKSLEYNEDDLQGQSNVRRDADIAAALELINSAKDAATEVSKTLANNALNINVTVDGTIARLTAADNTGFLNAVQEALRSLGLNVTKPVVPGGVIVGGSMKASFNVP